MRLGQLARKLEIRPIQIVEFLATQNIHIDNGTNTRMQPDHVTLAAQHFSGVVIDDPRDEALGVGEVESENQDAGVVETTAAAQPENITDEPPLEKVELIKAPKIELSGLKVLGMIDLPEVRKKEPDQPQENTERPKEITRERRLKEFRRNGPKNPIAMQREQEAMEARRKREEEGKLRKELRTQNYLKKVKAPQPTKAVRIFNEETQQISATDLQEPPKSLWGKFMKWLTT